MVGYHYRAGVLPGRDIRSRVGIRPNPNIHRLHVLPFPATEVKHHIHILVCVQRNISWEISEGVIY